MDSEWERDARETEEAMPLRCVLCGIGCQSTEEAINDGWVPEFYAGDQPTGPACSVCRDERLVLGSDGEYEQKGE